MILKNLDGNSKTIFRIIENLSSKRKLLQDNKSLIAKKIVKNVRLKGDNEILKLEKRLNRIKNLKVKNFIFSKKRNKFNNKNIK